MRDLQTILRQMFSRALALAFGEEHAETDPMVRPSDRADFQANVAMGLAKAQKRPPRQVAEALVEKLEWSDVCDKVEIAGPGFINLTLRSDLIGELAAEQLASERAGIPLAAEPEVVVIDYSAPNVAKEMHVGHLRGTIIGDALGRVLELRGHRVIRQNHLGDWGTPFGMLIEHLLDLGKGDPESDFAVADLNEFYQAAREKFDADAGFADRARRRVVSLQAGDEQTLALWRRLVAESKRHFERVYQGLHVKLTDADICGESFFNPVLEGVIAELEEKGLVTLDGGALCVFIPGFTSREGTPLPLIARKKDGGYGYATTDLAAIRYRTQTLRATRLLYVVGAPQQQHLAMIHEAARLAGWLVPPARAEHVAFGSVLGTDGKMLRTRAGKTIRLSELIDEGLERAYAEVSSRFPELDEETKRKVAEQVGIGAFKYADLSTDRAKDYTFDFDRMIRFEGNSAGYIQYAHARCRSVIRNAGGGPPEPGRVALTQPAERALALELLRLPSVVGGVEASLSPHVLCSYLYDVAVAFSGFYQACPILKAEPAERESRLRLTESTARVLRQGLDLLGIEAPDRM